MNKVVIKQIIGNFLFVINNPVIFFQDNVIGLLTFSMQKGAESRPELFYCFSPKGGAVITLSFVCLLICIRTIAREFFPQFVAMPDRPPPLFRHIGHLITTLHCFYIVFLIAANA